MDTHKICLKINTKRIPSTKTSTFRKKVVASLIEFEFSEQNYFFFWNRNYRCAEEMIIVTWFPIPNWYCCCFSEKVKIRLSEMYFFTGVGSLRITLTPQHNLTHLSASISVGILFLFIDWILGQMQRNFFLIFCSFLCYLNKIWNLKFENERVRLCVLGLKKTFIFRIVAHQKFYQSKAKFLAAMITNGLWFMSGNLFFPYSFTYLFNFVLRKMMTRICVISLKLMDARLMNIQKKSLRKPNQCKALNKL